MNLAKNPCTIRAIEESAVCPISAKKLSSGKILRTKLHTRLGLRISQHRRYTGQSNGRSRLVEHDRSDRCIVTHLPFLSVTTLFSSTSSCPPPCRPNERRPKRAHPKMAILNPGHPRRRAQCRQGRCRPTRSPILACPQLLDTTTISRSCDVATRQ